MLVSRLTRDFIIVLKKNKGTEGKIGIQTPRNQYSAVPSTQFMLPVYLLEMYFRESHFVII